MKPKQLSAAAQSAISRFDWPGNVRQLVHALERALVIGHQDEIEVEDLPPEVSGQPEVVDDNPEDSDSLLDNERKLVSRVLDETGWNIHEASRRLDISRPTLYSKIKKFGLERNG
jgi:transcriptional regulator of acetoin/glycerol metabolism